MNYTIFENFDFENFMATSEGGGLKMGGIMKGTL